MSSTNGQNPARRRSTKPYRDSALIYAAFGVVVVVIAGLTGGNVLWAIAAATGAFLVATAWSWRNIRARKAEKEQK